MSFRWEGAVVSGSVSRNVVKRAKGSLMIGEEIHKGEFPMTIEMKPGRHLVFVNTGKSTGDKSLEIIKRK